MIPYCYTIHDVDFQCVYESGGSNAGKNSFATKRWSPTCVLACEEKKY